MPRYAFEDPESGHQFELEMTYDELQEFKKEYPELHQVFVSTLHLRDGSTDV